MNPYTVDTLKKLKITVVLFGVVLVAMLVTLAWALLQNYWWRCSVDLIADEAGASWAMSTFRRGQLVIWEINPTNDFPRSSGRRAGPFEIWLDEYQAEMPAAWHYAERRKIEAYNRQMRYMYEHPERFTLGQDERKRAQRASAENRSRPIHAETNTTPLSTGSDR